MQKIDIPVNAIKIIEKLENAGYEAYVVGGCVRDSILGRQPHDWDICTNAKPEEMMDVFSGDRVIPTGIQHGTITVIADNTKEGYEVTTFRADGNYADGRHPDSVEFISDVNDDLARRDFTINAMAYSPTRGFIDPFNGMDDLNAGIIRCVGNPYDRFSEDALRIMRAIRFAANFGMDIEEETDKAANELAYTLDKIAKERITSELLKMFETAEKPGEMLYSHKDIMAAVVPEITACMGYDQQTPWHEFNVFHHITKSIDAVDMGKFQGKDLQIIRMAALLHDIGKPEMYKWDSKEGVAHFKGHDIKSAQIARWVLTKDLKVTVDVRETVITLVERHEQRRDNMPKPKKILNKIGYDTAKLLFGLQRADVIAHGNLTPDRMVKLQEELHQIDAVESDVDKIVLSGEAVTIKDLNCNGYDLITAGLKPGPEFGIVMETLLNKVMDGELPNNKEVLINDAIVLYYGMKEEDIFNRKVRQDMGKDMREESEEAVEDEQYDVSL